MKKTSVLCAVLAGVALALTGCANAFDHMPNLTEEESAVISEYAAGIIMKHSKYTEGLASDAEIAAYDEREAIRQANLAEYAKHGESGEEGEEAEEGGNGPDTGEAPLGGEEEAFSNVSIAQFCGADGFEIDYEGCELCDSYPSQDSEDSGDLVFAMDAQAGSRLLVLRFTARNVTDAEKDLDMAGADIRFRISVNGGRMESALSTLLLDDLDTYRGVLPAGASTTLVLVREIPEAEAGSIDTISLSMRKGSDSVTIPLQ